MHTPIESDDGDVFGEAAKCPTFSIFILFFFSCGQIDKLRSKQLKLSPTKCTCKQIFIFVELFG